MSKPQAEAIRWLAEVEEQDFPAAESYLSLLYPEDRVGKLMTGLRRAPVGLFKAKDILRASQLSPLGISNARVEKDRKKIQKGQGLSPLLLLRDEAHGKVVIADGYHRLCAVYSLDEDAWIPCKII